ncbi:MAG: hypothetical protein VX776_02810 [Planctomycetota bacterium]|nr:hypothetical protein [Planctomycetota bacterium]
MLKKRVSVIALALLLVSGFATFDQWRWLVGVYPEVSETDTDDLVYWLALADLESQAVSVRRQLVDRFQDELNQGWRPLETQNAKADVARYQQTIANNIETLTRDWFYYRCEQYDEVMDRQRRLGFVGPQVDTVLLWADMYSQVQNDGQVASEKNAFELFDKLDGWIGEAEEDKHDGLKRGIHHSVLYWLSTNSVGSLTLDTRRELAERIVVALSAGASESTDSIALTSEHYEQLQLNAFALVEVWLLNRSLEFVQLNADQRDSYLEKHLEMVKQWRLGKLLSGSSSSSDAEGQMQLLKLMGNLAVWAERAPEEHRNSYELLTKSLQQYALRKVLQLQ